MCCCSAVCMGMSIFSSLADNTFLLFGVYADIICVLDVLLVLFADWGMGAVPAGSKCTCLVKTCLALCIPIDPLRSVLRVLCKGVEEHQPQMVSKRGAFHQSRLDHGMYPHIFSNPLDVLQHDARVSAKQGLSLRQSGYRREDPRRRWEFRLMAVGHPEDRSSQCPAGYVWSLQLGCVACSQGTFEQDGPKVSVAQRRPLFLCFGEGVPLNSTNPGRDAFFPMEGNGASWHLSCDCL